MFKCVGGLLDRICAVLGAVLFLQIPLFIQDYQIELKGHVSELEWQVSLIQEAAKFSGKSLEQYIHKFLVSGDVDFVHQGEILSNMVVRLNTLSSSLKAISEAPIWERPFVFCSYLNYEIAKSTFHSFQMGMPLTLEAIVYGLLGMLIGFGLYQLTIRGLQRTWRLFRSERRLSRAV